MTVTVTVTVTVLTCGTGIRLNVAVYVETAVQEDEELSDPLAPLQVVQVAPAVRLTVGGGRHGAPLSCHVQPDVVLRDQT